MLSTLRVLGPSIMITLDTSLASLRILQISDFVSGKFISTRRLNILSKNFMCVTCISYNQRRSSPMSTFYKRLCVNTTTFLIQSSGSRLPTRRILKTNINFKSHTLWQLSSCPKGIWSKLTSRFTTVEMEVDLEEGNLTDQMWLFTSMERKAISIKLQVKGN